MRGGGHRRILMGNAHTYQILPTYILKSEDKIDIRPLGSYWSHPQVQGQQAHAETYPSSGARLSMGGSQVQEQPSIDSGP